jgi:hypothetical protein
MIRVILEVRNGAAHFDVVARAESIQQAASIVGARFPDADFRVKFPIDPGRFFVADLTALAGIVGFERPSGIAA